MRTSFSSLSGYLRAKWTAARQPVECAMMVAFGDMFAAEKMPAMSWARDSMLILLRGEDGDSPWPSMSNRCSE